MKLLQKLNKYLSKDTLPVVQADADVPQLTAKEKDFIENLGNNITKYGAEGEDRHLGEDVCQAISDFIGDNGAIFLVKRNGKPYYSSNFSYPKDAPQEQLERIFVRMSMIVREQIDGDEGELLEGRSIKKEMEDLMEANRAGALT